ncbi:MAG TPA: energy transducer TonB [Bryobacteraceae bacterium]|nr:energy transducer TonB [Bryobacteraceae bacterium]
MKIRRQDSMTNLLHWMVVMAVLGSVAFAQDEPRKITRSEALNAVAVRVQPEYPPMARQLRMQGSVEVEVLVGENGEVQKVDIVSGNAVLTASAVQAVKHWKFKPFLESGKPIRVLAPITVDFKL